MKKQTALKYSLSNLALLYSKDGIVKAVKLDINHLPEEIRHINYAVGTWRVREGLSIAEYPFGEARETQTASSTFTVGIYDKTNSKHFQRMVTYMENAKKQSVTLGVV